MILRSVVVWIGILILAVLNGGVRDPAADEAGIILSLRSAVPP